MSVGTTTPSRLLDELDRADKTPRWVELLMPTRPKASLEEAEGALHQRGLTITIKDA